MEQCILIHQLTLCKRYMPSCTKGALCDVSQRPGVCAISDLPWYAACKPDTSAASVGRGTTLWTHTHTHTHTHTDTSQRTHTCTYSHTMALMSIKQYTVRTWGNCLCVCVCCVCVCVCECVCYSLTASIHTPASHSLPPHSFPRPASHFPLPLGRCYVIRPLRPCVSCVAVRCRLPGCVRCLCVWADSKGV